MKRKVLTLALGTSCAIMMTGCATIFGGGDNQAINIKSDKQMMVDIYKVESKKDNGEDTSKKETKEPELIHKNITIPSSVNIERSNKDILIKPTNNECGEKRVEKKLNPWFWGDVVATSLLSTTVDAVTGAMWEYDDNVTMDCQESVQK